MNRKSTRKSKQRKPDSPSAGRPSLNVGEAIALAARQHGAGDLPGAQRTCEEILRFEPAQADALNLLGVISYQLGDADAAAHFAKMAIAARPEYLHAHNNLGNILLGMGKPEDALACFENALSIDPNYAEAHYNLGIALLSQGKFEEAMAGFRQAITLKPDYAKAHYNLCEVLEKANRIDELRQSLKLARKHCPTDQILSYREAQLLKRDGDFGAARALMESAGTAIPDPGFQMARAYFLGEVCDRQGDVNAAYNYFLDGNRRFRDSPGVGQIDKNSSYQRLDVLARRFSPEWIANWVPLETVDGRADPIFLVGFPRSGTTLLDTILRSHHDISVVEEKPTVQSMELALGEIAGGYPEGLGQLDSASLAELRQTYFAELDKHIDPGDHATIYIDKMPFNIVEAGFIHRIFPKARFLFSLRHPCDCVLSCFMQNFSPTDASVHFLDMQEASRLYDRAMGLWRQYQAVLPLNVHTVRYENIVDSFDETLKSVLDFIGVGWDENLRNFNDTARRRDMVSTASYDQVTQLLYTRADGRWRRYRELMQPALPTLLPWARHFGYDE